MPQWYTANAKILHSTLANSFFVLHRLQNSLSEGYCGKDCEDSLQHMLTTHIRSRYLAGQVSPSSVQSGAGAFVEEQQATVRLQHKLAALFQRYIEQKGLQRGWSICTILVEQSCYYLFACALNGHYVSVLILMWGATGICHLTAYKHCHVSAAMRWLTSLGV